MRWLLAALALLLLATPLAAQVTPSEGFDYRLVLDCPGGGTACPIKAEDGQDAMGDPVLAVDPFRDTRLIIASLHGGADNPDAPNAKSRSGGSFTTFTSTNGGASWFDNPYSPPPQVRNQGTAWGETTALTLSPFGQAFVGSLYSTMRGSEPEEGHDFILAAQKFRSLDSINEDQDGAYNAQFLPSVYPGNAIENVWFVFDRVTNNMTTVWLEKTTSASTSADAGMPRVLDSFDAAADHLKAAAQRATLREAGNLLGTQQQGSPAQSVIGVFWTQLDVRAQYHAQPRQDAIGPCDDATNPVIKQGYLYIGCKVGEGTFTWNPDAMPGDVEMFRMTPNGGTPEYLGPAPVQGEPKLGVRSDGRVALVAGSIENGQLALDAAYGQLNPKTGRIAWSEVQRYGGEVPEVDEFDVVDVNIQDLTYREYSGVLHLILKRNLERNSGAEVPFESNIHKSLIAVDERHGYLDYIDLDIGNIVNRTDPTFLPMSHQAFNDIKDDLLELPPLPHRFQGRDLGDSYARQFIAVGDYGIVKFAEVVELTDLRGPGPAVPSLPPPPAPAPAPAAVSSTAVAGSLSAAGVTAFAAAKMYRKTAAGAKKNK